MFPNCDGRTIALDPDMIPLIRRATPFDIPALATTHREVFPRQRDSEAWVSATLAATPRMFAFVAEVASSRVVGYAFWAQKSGIRASAVLELDQIAVLTEFRGKGFARHLIKESLAIVKSDLLSNHQVVKSILVSTRADNRAQRLYSDVLGVRIVATIDNLYSATEVLLLGDCPDA